MSRVMRRRGLILSVLTAASALFVFTKAYPERLIPENPVQAFILLGIAVLGIVVSLLGSRVGIVVVGALSILAGLARLVAGNAVIPGGIATGALLLGLGIAFVAIASATAPVVATAKVPTPRG